MEHLKLNRNDMRKVLSLALVFLSLIACKAQDSRELNIYLESNKHGYFAILYKKDSCSSETQKLKFHVDSTGIYKTTECFVSSNIITKHHFYLKIENNYKEIGYRGRGYKRDIDSLSVLGVKSVGIEGWDFMIYKFGTFDELSEPITEDSKDLREFEERCIAIATKKD